MPQYRNKQFISDMHKPKVGEYTNAPFSYPRRVVRYTEVDPKTGVASLNTKKLDRGYMRSLVTQKLVSTNLPVTQPALKQRFNFQFNPQDIEQNVQMRQDIYLTVLQPPEQFAQPMSAVATFNFDILLDRTKEVGEGAFINNAFSSTPNFTETDLAGRSNPQTDVYQIGVLSDIQVLYSIIGQGFSNEFIESQLAMIKQQARMAANDNPDEVADLAGIESITSDNFMGSENIGNSAFLIPMPVRVVFSELFMVDGFVTSTRTVYTKFNTNMVPIQATVGVSMNALYIGFAKEKTFLTTQLQNQLENQLNDISTALEQDREVLQAARSSAKQFVFTLDDSDSWEAGLGKEGFVPLYHYVRKNTISTERVREAKAGFKDAKAQKDNDKILKLYENGRVFTFSYSWRVLIWGPYTNATEANAAALAGRDRNKQPLKPVVGAYGATESASDKQSWDKIRSKSYRSKGNDKHDTRITNNQAEGALDDSEDLTGKYFVVRVSVETSVGGATFKFDDWQVRGPNDSLYVEKRIDWPVVLPGGTNITNEQLIADRPKPVTPRPGQGSTPQ